MIELVFGSADLLQVRFAISPAEEVLGAVRTVAQPARHAYHLPWLRRLRDTSLSGLAELTALVTSPRHYTPDFLSPPPTSPLADLDEQLDRLRAGLLSGPAAAMPPPTLGLSARELRPVGREKECVRARRRW
jgi:hypothetical protein